MLFALLLCCCSLALLHGTAAVRGVEGSLYSVEDNVKVLDNATFERELSTAGSCKLVQFINYFCGDCRRFAPIFRELAWQLIAWRRVLSIYVVDCAQERNVRICRDYEVRQTPMLRIFPPNFHRTAHHIGYHLNSLNPGEIFAKVAYYIGNMKYATGQPDFEAIKAVDNAQKILGNCTSHSHLVMVYQPVESTVGRDTILALLTWPTLMVRIINDRRNFANFGLSQEGTDLAIVNCAGKALYMHPPNATSTGYAASVAQYLLSMGYTTERPPSTTTLANPAEHLLDEEQATILTTVLQGFPKVYLADLEQSIDKLLHIELPKVRLFHSDNLLALQQLLNVLQMFSPLNASGGKLLKQLYEYVQTIGTSGNLTGVAFQLKVATLERGLPGIFKARRYVGCVASGPFQRHFTCSLWTLFHYLTVQTAKSGTVLPGGYVLRTIHGFVKHFFGCQDCVQHFLKMSERRRLFAVNTQDEEVLWLWQAHNEVNYRLAGDSTEDPKFPKLQFPSSDLCAECQLQSPQNTTWHTPAVLAFLKGLYDKKNLSYYGLPTNVGYD